MIFKIFSILYFAVGYIFFAILVFECLFIVTESIIKNSAFIDFIITKIKNRRNK